MMLCLYYNGILLEKYVIYNIGKCLLVLDGVSISMLLIIGVTSIIGRLYIINKIIYMLCNISMILCYVCYDIVFFIISYECILIRITVLVISSGSSGSKCGIIMLLYYTLIGSVFLIVLMLYVITNGISCNYFLLTCGILYVLLSIRMVMKFRIFRFLT